MYTLQVLYDLLTCCKLCPVYDLRTYVNPDGSLGYSAESISIFCPLAVFSSYFELLENILPSHFTYTHSLKNLRFTIEPTNKNFQFVANQIYSCTTKEMLDSTCRLIENSFDLKSIEGKTLFSLIAWKSSTFNSITS